MAAGIRVGLDHKMYRNTATFATPTWNEITLVVDASLNISLAKAPVVARGSAYRRNLAAIADTPIDFKIQCDSSVDDYDAIKDAAIARTVLDIALADDAIATTGTRYFRGDYLIFGYKESQPLEEVPYADVSIDLAYSSNAVTGWTTVGS